MYNICYHLCFTVFDLTQNRWEHCEHSTLYFSPKNTVAKWQVGFFLRIVLFCWLCCKITQVSVRK